MHKATFFHTATVVFLLEQKADIRATTNVCETEIFDARCILTCCDTAYLSILRMCFLPLVVFAANFLSPPGDILIVTRCCCRMEILPCTDPPGMVIRPPSPYYWSRGSISELRTMYSNLLSKIFILDVSTCILAVFKCCLPAKLSTYVFVCVHVRVCVLPTIFRHL